MHVFAHTFIVKNCCMTKHRTYSRICSLFLRSCPQDLLACQRQCKEPSILIPQLEADGIGIFTPSPRTHAHSLSYNTASALLFTRAQVWMVSRCGTPCGPHHRVRELRWCTTLTTRATDTPFAKATGSFVKDDLGGSTWGGTLLPPCQD